MLLKLVKQIVITKAFRWIIHERNASKMQFVSVIKDVCTRNFFSNCNGFFDGNELKFKVKESAFLLLLILHFQLLLGSLSLSLDDINRNEKFIDSDRRRLGMIQLCCWKNKCNFDTILQCSNPCLFTMMIHRQVTQAIEGDISWVQD